MTDYASFQHAAIAFPLTPSLTNSLLQDADPSLYYFIDYFASVLQTHMGGRLIAEAAAIGVPISTAVKTKIPLDPAPFMTQAQFEFPMLCVYRNESILEDRTITWRHNITEFTVEYILPTLSAGQAERIVPILNTIGRILDNRIENTFDPAYLSGAKVFGPGFADIETIRMTKEVFGHYEDGGGLVFPSWRGTLEVRERVEPSMFQTLSGTDVAQDLASPDEPTVLDVSDSVVTLVDPTTLPGLCLLATGDAAFVASDGFHVSHLVDQSTAGNNLIQLTSANQPQVYPRAFAGNGFPKAAVRFDGQTSFLQATVPQLANNTGKTFVVLCRLFDVAKRSTLLMQTSSGDSGNHSAGIEANTVSTAGNLFGLFADSSSFDSGFATDGEWHVLSLVETNTTSGGVISSTATLRVDGNPLPPLTLKSGTGLWQGMATSNLLALGALPTAIATTALSGDIGVVIACASALGLSDLQNAELYCRQWGGFA